MLTFPDEDEGSILCPRLAVFHFSASYARYTDQAILGFIRAKQTSPPEFGLAKLRCLKLFLYRHQVPIFDDIQDLKGLPLDEGGTELELVLRYTPHSRVFDMYSDLPS